MINKIARVLKALALSIIGFIVLVTVACSIQIFIWLIPAAILIGVVWLLLQNTEINKP